MAGLSIQLMGPFYVTLGGQPVTSFEYDKVRALLAYLAVEQERPHRREALAGLLWPDLAEEAAESNLRNALSRLRRAITDQQANPPYLIIHREEIQFNSNSDHWLDIYRFNQLLETCRVHTHRRIEACSSCTDRLIEAVNLYRGKFLEGFSLPDSDQFENWLRTQRDELQHLAVQALGNLASTYEWRGDPDRALSYAQRQLKLDTCKEEAYTQIMKIYATMGKCAEACKQYEKCRKVLLDELGIEPADETVRLYEQIKYGLFQSSSRQSFRINNLPTHLTSFVGREQELREIRALTENPMCRLLTLVGLGGVGKTRLAIAAASQLLGTFAHGACFVSLQGQASIEGIVPAVLQAVEYKPASNSDLKMSLLDHLREKEMVIVLDNFEQLLEGAGLITEMLQAAPGIMVLVTSRQRLGLQAEWIFEVSGLSYPCGKEMRELTSYEAVQLFTQRLYQLKPRQAIFQDDMVSVGHICRMVEGLPLGIELAASTVKQKTIEQVAIDIEGGKEDLKSSWNDVPERHRSIRAVFEHSYRMLKEDEQSAFIGLGVFRSVFSAEAAEQVAGGSKEILDVLVEHSLLRYDSSLNLYRLHELIRQFAEEKLRLQGNLNSFLWQHCLYFTSAVDVWNQWIEGINQGEALKEMDQYLPDIYFAWQWACQQQNLEGLSRTWQGLCRYYQYRYRITEGEEACQNAIAILDNIKDINSSGKRLKVKLLVYLVWFQNYTKENLKSQESGWLLDHCLDILADLQNEGEDVRREIAYVLREKSNVIGDYKERLKLAQCSVDVARQLENPRSISLSLFNLAAHHYYAGNFIQAECYLDEAINLMGKSGDPHQLSTYMQVMSEIAAHLGKVDKAIEAAKESLHICSSFGTNEDLREGLECLGNTLFQCGYWEEANKYFAECAKYSINFNIPYKVCEVYAEWSISEMFAGNYNEAWAIATSNIELAQQINDKQLLMCNNFTLGGISLVRGHLAEAKTFLEKSMYFCEDEQNVYKFQSAQLTGTLSLLYSRMDITDIAQRWMLEALKCGIKCHSYINLGFALSGAALLLAISGEHQRSLELFSLIYEKAWCGKSPWIEDVVGKKIKELAEGLPAEVRQEALERGKKMNLFDTVVAFLVEFERKQDQAVSTLPFEGLKSM